MNNEKIDVINWSSEPEIYIQRALSPAKPGRIILNDSEKTATAIIPDDQISLAIGKGGQNRQLASRLTGYEITTVKESEWLEAQQPEEKLMLVDIPELSKAVVEKLLAAGYETADEILDTDPAEFLSLKGFGQKTVERLFDVLNSYYEEESAEGQGQSEKVNKEEVPGQVT